MRDHYSFTLHFTTQQNANPSDCLTVLEASAPLACVQKSGLDSRADFGARIKEGREAFACERERERERVRVENVVLGRGA